MEGCQIIFQYFTKFTEVASGKEYAVYLVLFVRIKARYPNSILSTGEKHKAPNPE